MREIDISSCSHLRDVIMSVASGAPLSITVDGVGVSHVADVTVSMSGVALDLKTAPHKDTAEFMADVPSHVADVEREIALSYVPAASDGEAA